MDRCWETPLKVISGAIVVLAGAILAAAGGFGDLHLNNPLVLWGFFVGLAGFVVMALGWREPKE